MDVATERKEGTLKRRHTALKAQLIAQNFQSWGLLPALTDSSVQMNCVVVKCQKWGHAMA